MQSAELALHAAKKEGRACFRLYNAGMRSEADLCRMLERDLKGAIELGQLDVHYQPILETRTNRISGYEALVRWRHPILGMIPPLSFIPLAEETGLIVPLGSLVLNTACREVQQLGSDVKVAVNFSAVQFQKSDVVAVVAAALEQSGLSANRLTIEITELMVMQADPKTLMTLQLLRDRGVAIAMDDFGTGYSSLGYLQTYPIDCIKIDRSFVQSLGQMQKAAVIIKAIAALAAGLGMTTVAEGVETQEELDQLRAIGCDAVQGYFVSRPMPAVAILTTMQGQKRMLSAAA